MNQTAKKLTEIPLTLFVGPRPGRKSLNRLLQLRLTHLCTLLDEHEDAGRIESIARQLDAKWIWLPIRGGRIKVLQQIDLKALLARFADELNSTSNNRVYLHCSAGIHRTGFVAYAILRLRGLDEDNALAKLRNMRKDTCDQLGEERIELAEVMLSKFDCS